MTYIFHLILIKYLYESVYHCSLQKLITIIYISCPVTPARGDLPTLTPSQDSRAHAVTLLANPFEWSPVSI